MASSLLPGAAEVPILLHFMIAFHAYLHPFNPIFLNKLNIKWICEMSGRFFSSGTVDNPKTISR
jgi:hypothetical protein